MVIRQRLWFKIGGQITLASLMTASLVQGESAELAVLSMRVAQVSPATNPPSTGPAPASDAAKQPAAGQAALPQVGGAVGLGTSADGPAPGVEMVPGGGFGGYTYDPSGRRDPFTAILLTGQMPGEADLTVPPLQRVGLTELNLIGIIWGAYGYVAMVQTPDGKGYTVRRGTRIGPNNGVVSTITENAIIVQERFTDVYGKKQEREYVKPLHTKEGTE